MKANHLVRIPVLVLAMAPLGRAQGALLPVLPYPECPAPQLTCSVDLQAGKAWCNAASPPKFAAYDFIPVDCPDQGFYVVYSHRSTPANNVNIFIIALDPGASGRNQVLIFGSGYGDTGIATFGAECDALWTDYVIRNELGFNPCRTDIELFAPHGHVDHINPEYIHKLGQLSYRFANITFHAADYNLVQTSQPNECMPGTCPITFVEYQASGLPEIHQMAWQAGDPLRMGTPAFFENTIWFSPLGTIRFDPVPGHTCGSIDLILQQPTRFVRILGSNNVCPTPPWAVGSKLYDIPAHGNLTLPNVCDLPCP